MSQANSILRWTELLPLACELGGASGAAMFTGASIYINACAVPMILSMSTKKEAVDVWDKMYNFTAVYQGSIAVFSSAACLSAGYLTSHRAWYLSAGLMASIVPFTMLVIMPTNNRLKAIAKANREPSGSDDSASSVKRDEQVTGLVELWNSLHAVRSVISFVALSCALWELKRGA
ncbi:hypothetical protein BC936DRAFT_140331 [Jimgerdemannia flammicorona]|nr:hypothetical protein BC936DRAFT_140331 [Jimgerdemannia flammicorona]